MAWLLRWGRGGGDSAEDEEQLAEMQAAVNAAQVELHAVLNPVTAEATGKKGAPPPAEVEVPDAHRVVECEAVLAEKQQMLKETTERLDVRRPVSWPNAWLCATRALRWVRVCDTGRVVGVRTAGREEPHGVFFAHTADAPQAVPGANPTRTRS